MRAAAAAAIKRCEVHTGGLPTVACGYSFRIAGELGLPSVVGLSTPREVHEAMRAFRELRGGPSMGFGERRLAEEEVKELFVKEGMLEWSWASPPQ
jgi:D-arabinose 1-dehydrogenase